MIGKRVGGAGYLRGGRGPTGVGTSLFNYSGSCSAMASMDGPYANDTISYGYDVGKRLVSVTSASSVVAYSYDALNRITQVLANNRTNAYTYLGNGSRVASLAHGNGMQTTYGYDLLRRLTNQATRTSGGEVLRSFAYAYNNADERIQLAREDGQVQDYGYDPISQLVSAKGNQPSYDFAYTYDPSGNPLRQNNNGYILGNAFNNLNQHTTSRWSGTLTVQGVMNIANGTVTVNGTPATTVEGGAPATPFFVATNCPVVNGSNTYTAIITDPFGRTATNSVSVVAQNRGYGYDLNGNMTNDGQYSYAWDNADRLTEVRTLAGTQVMTCKYDGLSRRRERILWQDGVGQTNRYVYDGWLVLEIRDGGNNTLETYTHGPDLSSTRGGAGGIGGILTMSYASPSAPCAMLYAHYDGNGNILAATDTNQALVAAFEYGPFGTLLLSSGPAANAIRYRFSSKEWDSPVGLYYYGFRFYSTALGRWLSRDPLGEPGGINIYTLLINSPVNYVDILGFVTLNVSVSVNNDGKGHVTISIIPVAIVKEEDWCNHDSPQFRIRVGTSGGNMSGWQPLTSYPVPGALNFTPPYNINVYIDIDVSVDGKKPTDGNYKCCDPASETDSKRITINGATPSGNY